MAALESIRFHLGMLRKPIKYSARFIVFFALSMVGVICAPQAFAQAPEAPVSPAGLIQMFADAEAAFAAKDYPTAVAKIQGLLAGLGTNKEAPLEMLYFNIGLGNLLGEKAQEAEAGFLECLKRYPRGEYASRSYLGIGRACIDQDTPESKLRAIEALKTAAQDPKFRSEAGLWLGQVYTDLGKRDEALTVFKSLMGSDIRSPQQTTAAVEVIALLADTGKLEDLIMYLDRLSNQAGIRDALAWYANQVIVRGDELVGLQSYESALAIYRSVPPRSQILQIQKTALESQRKDLKILEARVELEKNKPLGQRSSASELVGSLKPAIELAEKALAAVEEKTDLDAALLMRRGRCLFYLERHEEALVCFRALRNKYSTSSEAKAAAYAEIVIINKLKNIPELKVLCDAYTRKYPDADNAEQVATLAGEVLVQSGNWPAVGNFYRDLEARFPKSESLDRYTFYQGLAIFQDGNFKEAVPIFTKFIKTFPNSLLIENALYYMAMSNFLSNEYKKTLASCKEYLSQFPDGRYAGDLRYRLAFIDFNDKEVDQSNKIIKDLTTFLKQHPDDSSAGSMYCLLADTYKKKTSDKPDELAKFQRLALEAYKNAIWGENLDDVVQYALDSSTTMLSGNKDYAGIAALHGEFLQRKPTSPLALLSASQVAKMKAREGKGAEAAEMLANALKSRIADPSAEQVEFLIDELVKTLVPRKKAAEVDVDAIDKQLIDVLNQATAGNENATSNARLYYARARLAQLLKRADRSDLYLKGIATINAKDPKVLSPALLAVSGDILLKLGNLDDASAMFTRLSERYKEGMFADAGPVGLGYVALARKQPEEALEIFETALTSNPGMSRFKETTFGKLQALAALGRDEEAEKLALEIAGDKVFRGEFAGKAYIILAGIYRKQAEKAASPDAKAELLKKAHGTYQRVYVANQSVPEVAAEAYWQAYETALALSNTDLANETLKALAVNPKLKNTARAKKAVELAK
ncbi:MAG: outer membrane protein assembly factor BamD [Akkermansiaceae bacterium]|nr:outer membrane protein assembly factor BamD [Akkermansiaceae bacterium]